MNLHELDADTIALIIELQREDLESLANGSKGKHREGEGPDSDYAFQIYQEELATLEASVADHRMGITIGRPDGTDEGVAAIGTGVDDGSPHTASSREEPVDGLSANLQGLDLNNANKDPLDEPESSAWGASRAHHPGTSGLDRRESRECISCQEQHDPTHLVSCPCSHEYCRDCLASVFEASTADETMFPPRCCRQPIPLSDVENMLPADLVAVFEAKEVEFEMPNRVYCHQSTCSAFIPTASIKDNIAHCPQCALDTCSICKKASHKGECPEDPALQEVLRVAAENGWQQCTNCGRILELNLGCYHMTCPCKHQFCYLCNRDWKTCPCSQWDEDRLTIRVDRLAQTRRGADREAVRERARQEIVNNHECDVHDWQYRRGGGECDECNYPMPVFHFECRRCHLVACRQCALNRV